MSRSALSASVVLASLLLQTGTGLAEPCDDDCTGIVIFGQTTIQQTLQRSRMIGAVVGDRLAPSGASPEGAALQYAPTAEPDDPAAQAINGETASLATNDPAMNWNVWFDTSLQYADRSHPSVSFDGPMFTASLGADRAVGEASVIGLLVNFEHSDFDTNIGGVPGSLQGDGFGIGAYAGSAITDHIVADAMLIWSHIDNDIVDGGGPDNFDSSRIQAAANLTGYWYRDAWRYSPTLGITYTNEHQDSYGGTPSRTLDSAVAIAGMQVGHTRQFPREWWTPEQDPDAILEPASEMMPIDLLIRGYTLNGAYQLRMEDRIGSIEPGKAADLVILGENLFETDRYDIHKVTPDAVVMDGVLLHGSLE